MTARTGVIVVAGGSGRRLGGDVPKQFRLLGGMPVLARTINALAAALPGAPIVAVLPEAHIAYWRNLAARFDVARHTVAVGGAERFHSVRNGLAALPETVELIAVHDGVRPMASAELIRRTTEAAATHGAAVPAIVPADSFRETDGTASRPTDRSRLRAVQTPQVFEAALLRRAYETEFSPAFTDDASVVEHAGHPVFLCEGERRNFKITAPEDLVLAEALLAPVDERDETGGQPANADEKPNETDVMPGEAAANGEPIRSDDRTASAVQTGFLRDTPAGSTVAQDTSTADTAMQQNTSAGYAGAAARKPASGNRGPEKTTVPAGRAAKPAEPEQTATPTVHPADKTASEQLSNSGAAHPVAHTSRTSQYRTSAPHPAETSADLPTATGAETSGSAPDDDFFGGGAGAIR